MFSGANSSSRFCSDPLTHGRHPASWVDDSAWQSGRYVDAGHSDVLHSAHPAEDVL